MPSQFFGLNIAASGLRAANAALNTTGNNIANANTDGYSRQKVETSASLALRVFTTYGSAGAGVDTLAIERVRDVFYDNKYRNNQTNLGEVKAKNYYNQMIEQYLDDDGSSGFSSLFDQMQASLQTVMKGAGTTENKQEFVSRMEALTDYFNQIYTSLQNEQLDVNEEIKMSCDRINAISQEITTLNEQINIVEMQRGTANDLRDKRDVLVDELAEIISIEVNEYPIVDVNDPDRDTGANRFVITVAGGQPLLDTYNYRKLVCIAREADQATNQTDAQGLYDIKWAPSNFKEGDAAVMESSASKTTTDQTTGSRVYSLSDFRMDSKLIGGKLEGLIAMRDGNNGSYFNGTVTYSEKVPTGTDGQEVAKIKVKVSDSALMDMNKCNIPETGTLMISGRYYDFTSWEYDGGDTYTLTLSDESTAIRMPPYTVVDKNGEPAMVDKDRRLLVSDGAGGYIHADDGTPVSADEARKDILRTCSIGASIEYEGIPYYMQQMNEWIRNFSAEVNEIMTSGYAADSEAGVYLLTGAKGMDSSGQYSYEELTTKSKNKRYYTVTAGNFAVSAAVHNDVNRLATKKDVTEGESEYLNMYALNEMITKKEIFRGATSGQFLDKVLGDVGLNTANSRTLEDTYTALEKTIGNQRLSVSGVDSDEEAAALVQYEQSYTLNSKMIQTLTEIYDRLILETGV
ncbi:MAG: flagellar hook-associated protein FlgK [Butyrivibrio sp.]|nr:flagellar hook-associated protein FlgK [Butyrivibrio sp.]